MGGGRVTQLGMIGPRNNVHNDEVEPTHPVIDLVDEGNGYLSGTLPPPDAMENTPYFISGFLDYGDFGEGDGPKKDLQYTFSAQLSSTNPNDDFTYFLHPVVGTNANSSLLNHPVESDPFTIALKNFGPPYRVVLRGVSKTTPVSVCLYEEFENRKIGCTEGSHNGAHHLTIESIAETEVFHPCQTYFALANATVTDEGSGKVKSLWSSTSVAWNGPCDANNGFRRNPVSTWYTKRPFRGAPPTKSTMAEESAAATNTFTSPLRSSASGHVTLVLIFVGGLLVGICVSHMMMKAKSSYGSKNNDHSKIISSDDDTVGYSDDTGLVEGVQVVELA